MSTRGVIPIRNSEVRSKSQIYLQVQAKTSLYFRLLLLRLEQNTVAELLHGVFLISTPSSYILLHKTDTTRYITAQCEVCFLLLPRELAPSCPQTLDLGVARPIFKNFLILPSPLFSITLTWVDFPLDLITGESVQRTQKDFKPRMVFILRPWFSALYEIYHKLSRNTALFRKNSIKSHLPDPLAPVFIRF